MISSLYMVALLISIGDLLYLSTKKNRGIDRYIWSFLLLIPVIILGYWLKTTVHTAEGAMIAFCFIYLDSTIIVAICLFSILNSIRVNIPGWIKFGVYGITIFHLVTIWLSKDNNLYYSSMELFDTGIGTATRMGAGPLKITHYIYLGTIFLAILITLIVGFARKETYSKRALLSYSISVFLGLFIYVIEMICDVSFSILPVYYACISLYITIIFNNVQSHSIHVLIGERQSKTGKRGFIAFDKKKRLLGFNSQFASIFPDIENVAIDTQIKGKYQSLGNLLYPLLDRCINQGNYTDLLTYQNRIYSITVSSFSINDEHIKNGYLMELTDVTEEQERVSIIEKYNERLAQNVKEKTAHILEMQNSVVLGLANLVENRDDNTGGHVKRTSDIVKMLMEEALKQKIYKIDDIYAADIVRAAPMHDLGKMYIETSILCKPSRLTDEEFAIMKTHSVKSGEMVHIILDEVEEPHFVNTAFNIARFHHERWDGRGYPEGLMGEAIPLEARIMAVADVYDALVSKRCYKEPMSFDVARKIMNDNMGTQFDPAMRPVFNSCIDQLEAYYSKDREEN